MKKISRIWIYTWFVAVFLIFVTRCKKDDETPTTITDIDGNEYHTVTIGKQIWMVENLKTTKYRNGDLIATSIPATLDISSESSPKYQWAYNGDESKVATYGRLYTWDALNTWYPVTDSRNICPIGWHVPSDDEWTTLATYLGSVAGGKLKENGTFHWESPNAGATNESGFTALPGGIRLTEGQFEGLGKVGAWWSSTGDGSGNAEFWSMYWSSDGIRRLKYDNGKGFSVRCLRD